MRTLVRHDLLDGWTAEDMLTWQGTGGFSAHGSVHIPAHDRGALERLVRHCARPPWAASRLGKLDDDTLSYKLPPGDVYGREYITLTPLELLDRLAALVVPPRVHRHTFAGVFAPNAALRSLVPADVWPRRCLRALPRRRRC